MDISELRELFFCDHSWFVAVHYVVLIEVPMAILANCGLTDDGQRAITKVHLTFDQMSYIERLRFIIDLLHYSLPDTAFSYLKQRIF